MKRLYIFASTLCLMSVYGQTFEEKASAKSCECLKEKAVESEFIDKDIFNSCLRSSVDFVLKEMEKKEVKKITKNMMVFANSIKKIQAITIERCGLKPIEEK